MPRLQIETRTDVLDMDEQLSTGMGFQVHAGATGLGFPSVDGRWLEGAGDGATFRGSRTLARDIDLPMTIVGSSREDLKKQLSRLAVAMSGECTLRLVEDDGSSWYVKARRIGGGNYTYGADTDGVREIALVITMRAGDPYWTAENKLQAGLTAAVVRGLLPGLVSLRVSASQAIGSITFENPGDAEAYPTWTVTGPGDNFRAISAKGEALHWTGTLLAGASITIDTERASVVDNTGAKRYSSFAAAPRMWRIPPGLTVAEASLQNTTPASKVTCTWRPRRWLVI